MLTRWLVHGVALSHSVSLSCPVIGRKRAAHLYLAERTNIGLHPSLSTSAVERINATTICVVLARGRQVLTGQWKGEIVGRVLYLQRLCVHLAERK